MKRKKEPAAKPATLIADPEKAYEAPAEILTDDRLTEKEKIKALEGWETDQKALLRAEDDSMPDAPVKNAPPPEEMLRKIQRAERKLRDIPPSKSGQDSR
jgi:hypothetical protein